MPVFTAIAAGITAVAGAIGFSAAAAATVGAVGAFAARTLLTIGITKLIANRSGTNAAGAQDAGARVQLPPSTNNVLPVVYGSAFVAPTIIDAKISSDQKTMWYVCALSEVTDTGSFTFGNIYYNGSLVTFDGTDPAKIIKLTNNANPPQEDTKISGNVYMYLFPNGSSSGVNTGGQTAIQIMSNSAIPADERWDSTLYTQGGTATASMTKTAFVIVKINYNQNSGFTSIGQINVQLTNTLNKPGDVFKDYMINSRYGCALPLSQIDLVSLDSLNTYSNELITYISGGVSSTQPRYRINGPMNTGQSCLNNLQIIADSCDSWLQYSELTGKWKIVINRSYTDDVDILDLYHVDSYNLIGGIDINPIDLNSTYNSLEVQYPDANIKDQTNYRTINLIDFVPEVMSPNEPANKLIVQFPIVNNYIQATYLGERRMLQSREDLVITCALDYSGIQIEAGDVIRVTLPEYGWEAPAFPYGKLFRVTQVQETKDDSGFLGARITASEYNDSIYSNNPIEDFIPEANTGLKNPNISSNPGTPVFTTNPLSTSGAVISFSMTSSVPTAGAVTAMNFNLGTSSNIATHKLYSTLNAADGVPFTPGQSLTISVNDQLGGIYYGSVTAMTVGNIGYNSSVGGPYTWTPNLHANSVSYTNINSTVIALSPLGNASFRISDPVGNTVTMPIAATSSTNNVPVYIIGTGIPATNWFPTYQGTASTAGGTSGNNFYLANSTSSWNPALAGVIGLISGDDNWYKIINVPVTNTVTTSEQMNITLRMQLVSDTNETVIQYAGTASFTGSSFDQIPIHGIDSQVLYANLPTYVTYNSTIVGSSGIDAGAIYIRNITPGANLTVGFASLVLTKQKL